MSESSVQSYLPLSDKYFPKTFSECDHSQKTSTTLNRLSNHLNENEAIPNIALYGPDGCGKYTRLMIMLNKCFGHKSCPYRTSVKAICTETGSFVPLPNSKNKSKEKVIYALVSKLHCEIELDQANVEKALFLFLEYYSRTKNIYLDTQKYIILRNMECLKKETQNALRRIVEIYQNKIRFLITISSISKLIGPLRSRFLCICVNPPKANDASTIINKIAEKENFIISKNKIESIIEKSKCGTHGSINLHELLLTLEGSLIISNGNKIVKIYSSERNDASDLLIKAVKKGNRDDIRNMLYKIYETMKDDFKNIITCDFYRKMLTSIKNDDDKTKFVSLTATWNTNINKNYILQPIFQAEAYIYSVCKLYGV
jgi:replication factor C subunit 3/5